MPRSGYSFGQMNRPRPNEPDYPRLEDLVNAVGSDELQFHIRDEEAAVASLPSSPLTSLGGSSSRAWNSPSILSFFGSPVSGLRRQWTFPTTVAGKAGVGRRMNSSSFTHTGTRTCRTWPWLPFQGRVSGDSISSGVQCASGELRPAMPGGQRMPMPPRCADSSMMLRSSGPKPSRRLRCAASNCSRR